MNSKLIAVLLVCLVASANAAGPFCSLCVKIIDGVKKDFNNDFTNVTQAQLEADADSQCAANTSGLETTMCKSIIKQDSATLLAALKAGKSSNDCCVEGGMC